MTLLQEPPIREARTLAPVRFGRTLLVGLLGSAATSVIVAAAELVAQTIQIGMMQLPPAVVALFFVVVLVNRMVAWVRPHAALRTPELVVVFVMMLFSAMKIGRASCRERV